MPSTITLEVLSWDRERRRTQNPCDAPASITIEAGRTGFGVSERHARSWHFDHFVETCWDPGFTRVRLVLELGEEDLRLLPEGFPVVTVNDQQLQGSDEVR